MYRRKINLLLLFLCSVSVYSANVPKPDAQNAPHNEKIGSNSNNSDKVVETRSILKNIADFTSKESIEMADECDCGEHATKCRYSPWAKKICECESGYSQKGDKCAECSCGDHESYCLFHDDFEYKICKCKYGYVDVNGTCTDVTSSTKSPPEYTTTIEPECSCGSDSFGCVYIWDKKKTCNCSPFYAQVGETCLKCYCGADAYDCRFDTVGNKVCDCRPGYAQKDGKCTECSCGENSNNCLFDWNGKEVCKCSPGYAQRNGTCSETCKGDRDCSPGQTCRKEGDGYFCGCPADYIGEDCKKPELCVQLEPTCKRMGATCVVDGEPVCRCPPEKTLDLSSGLCENICNPERCSHGKCLEIGEGSYFCECDKGYTGRHCDKEIETGNRNLIIGILAVLGVATAVSIVGNLCFICRKKKQIV